MGSNNDSLYSNWNYNIQKELLKRKRRSNYTITDNTTAAGAAGCPDECSPTGPTPATTSQPWFYEPPAYATAVGCWVTGLEIAETTTLDPMDEGDKVTKVTKYKFAGNLPMCSQV